MKAVVLVLALLLVLAASGDLARTSAEEANQPPLRVCLNENLPPFSVHNKKGDAGFDLMMARALAKRLGRSLAVQWYESELDFDSSPSVEANALLSDGRCALLAGYPLVRYALGKPGMATGRCRILPALAAPIAGGVWPWVLWWRPRRITLPA